MSNNKYDYIIYTDGAYSPTKSSGGIGFVILDGDYNLCYKDCKQYINTTNQRMELRAAILALNSIQNKSNIKLISDSAYLVNTMMKGWKRKANTDLWDMLDVICNKHNVVFEWVRGHDGDKYNEIADDLAVIARDKIN